MVLFYPPAGERIGYLLVLSHDRIIGAVKSSLSQMGISMLQYRFLWLIKSDQFNRSQAAIASKLDLTPTAISRMISEMTEAGWVAQTHNPRSRREKFIKLTEQGKKMLKQASQLSFSIQTELLAHISKDDQQELKRLLRLALRDQSQEP